MCLCADQYTRVKTYKAIKFTFLLFVTACRVGGPIQSMKYNEKLSVFVLALKLPLHVY